MRKGVFSSGTLLWLDDNFLDAEYRTGDSDLTFWSRTIGDADHRVHRLLNLVIDPVTSLSEFDAVVDEYVESAAMLDRFIFGVVDLHVPERTPPSSLNGAAFDPAFVPKMRHGLEAAERLAQLGIPFIFLSSSSDAQKNLVAAGLQSRPYFQKVRQGRGAMMPPEAVRYILQEFRSNINWLDVSDLPLSDKLRDDTSDGDARDLALSYFPFFGAYRDFVERWELRSEHASGCNKIVLRTPRTHSKEFICQCALFVAQAPNFRSIKQIEFVDASRVTPRQIESFGEISDETLFVVRFHGEIEGVSASGTQSVLPEAATLLSFTKDLPRSRVIFCLPPDESADGLLTELSSVAGIYYDDLPETRLQDSYAREELLRRASQFVLQSSIGRILRAVRGPGQATEVDPIYLDHPELLINPVNWTFLLEADQIAERISDPVEVLLELFLSLAGVLDQSQEEIEEFVAALTEGRPWADGKLFRTAQGVLTHTDNKDLLPIWTVRAFNNWLSRSWNTPYGCVPEAHRHRERWSEQCVAIGRRLAHEAAEYLSTHRPLLIGHFGAELVDEMLRAAEFLLDPAVDALLGGDHAVNWDGFEARRWPHSTFPVPTHLNNRLHIDGGRYFFPHANDLDSATLLVDGRHALRRLELRANFYRQRIEWADKVVDVLPSGWSAPLRLLIDEISNRSIMSSWENDPAPIWYALSAIQRNAVRVSSIVAGLWSPDGFRSAKKVNEFASDLRKLQGPGRLLDRIRSARSQMIPSLIGPADCPYWRAQALALNEARESMRYLAATEAAVSATRGQEHVPALMFQLLQMLNGRLGQSAGETLTARDAFDTLFNESVGLVKGLPAVADMEQFEAGGRFDKLSSIAFHSDVLLALTGVAAALNPVLRPIAYCDGYHFLSMLYDRRNMNKEMPPAMVHGARSQLLDFFVYGLEGLVLQLKWLLYVAGQKEQADAIFSDILELTAIPEPAPHLVQRLVRITEQGDGTYGVYTPGHEGENVVSRFSYTDFQKNAILLQTLTER